MNRCGDSLTTGEQFDPFINRVLPVVVSCGRIEGHDGPHEHYRTEGDKTYRRTW